MEVHDTRGDRESRERSQQEEADHRELDDGMSLGGAGEQRQCGVRRVSYSLRGRGRDQNRSVLAHRQPEGVGLFRFRVFHVTTSAHTDTA